MTILVVEDERQLNTMIRDYLETLGWSTVSAENGHDALTILRNSPMDFVLLDVMMPTLDGLDVMRRIRDFSEVPVIFITAMADETDKLIGLELGADDYIVKPFSLKEMAARIRTVMRRVDSKKSELMDKETAITVGDLVIDASRRTVRRQDRLVELTTVQFDILYGFMKHPGRVFRRSEILGFFQDHAWEGYDRTIDVHIKNIRKQLEPRRDQPQYLETVRGVGYRLAEKQIS